MKQSNPHILEQYLDTTYLLHHVFPQQSHEQRRVDGLEFEALKGRKREQLFAWSHKYRHLVKHESILSIEDHLHYALWLIVIIMFIFGFAVSSAFLYYSGDQLVNVFNFFIFLIAIPFLLILISFAAVIKNYFFDTQHKRAISIVKTILSLLKALPGVSKEKFNAIKIDDQIIKSVSFSYLQYGSIAFYSGVLSALIVTIVSQDIAFGWNTTLDITPHWLVETVNIIAFAWKEFIPSGVPSLELIELSHHFRLGNKLDPTLVSHAKTLGNWWLFLALSLLVWGILPRLLLIFLARKNISRTIERTLLADQHARNLLKEMNEPYITTSAHDEETFTKSGRETRRSAPKKVLFANIIGWNREADKLHILLEHKQLNADHIHVAGAYSLIDDDVLIASLEGSTLVVVSAWEPPMKDFLRFIRQLSDHLNAEIVICPVGTALKGFLADQRDIEVWSHKIDTLSDLNVIVDGVLYDT